MDSIKAHAAYELSDELYMILSKADLAYKTLCDASTNYSSYGENIGHLPQHIAYANYEELCWRLEIALDYIIDVCRRLRELDGVARAKADAHKPVPIHERRSTQTKELTEMLKGLSVNHKKDLLEVLRAISEDKTPDYPEEYLEWKKQQEQSGDFTPTIPGSSNGDA